MHGMAATEDAARRRFAASQTQKETAGSRAGGFKLAPSGRAGVRAMKGPQRFERREAPIRCGFARTYVPNLPVSAPRHADPTRQRQYNHTGVRKAS